MTEALRILLGYIIHYKAVNGGNSPSYEEMATHMNCRKKKIFDMVRRLVALEQIKIDARTSRSISIPGATWSAPISDDMIPYITGNPLKGAQ